MIGLVSLLSLLFHAHNLQVLDQNRQRRSGEDQVDLWPRRCTERVGTTSPRTAARPLFPLIRTYTAMSHPVKISMIIPQRAAMKFQACLIHARFQVELIDGQERKSGPTVTRVSGPRHHLCI